MDIFTLVGKIVIDGSEQVNKGLDGLQEKLKANEKQLKAVGAAATAIGGAITGFFALAVKSAQEEEINIQRLNHSLQNVGVSYEAVSDSLEKVITATQRKTGIADSEQRDVLGRLVLVTNDYNKALSLLPLTLDLAARGQIDANTAATYLSKALLDLENGAESVSIRLGQASIQFKDLAELEERVKGSAEAAANPFKILTAEVGDLVEGIGKGLLPMLKDLIENNIVPVIAGVKDWIEQNPELTKQITIVAAAVGAVTLALGGLLLIMPGVTAAVGLFGTTASIALAGIPVLIGALTAAGVLLWQNWDKVLNFFKAAWENMRIWAATAIKFIVNTVLAPFMIYVENVIGNVAKGIGKLVGVFNKDLGKSIEDMADKLKNARQEIGQWADNLIDSTEIERDARRAQMAIAETTEATRKELEERQQLELQSLNDSRNAAQKEYDDAIEMVRKKYGVLENEDENYQESKMDAARKAADEVQKQLDREISDASKAYNEKIKLIDAEYAARLKLVDEEAARELEKLQNRIDAIDRQTEAENQAAREQERVQKETELQAAVDSAATEEERLTAINELQEYQAQIERERLLEARQAEKDALREQMDEVRDAASEERDRLRDELDEKKTFEKEKLDLVLEGLRMSKEAEEKALEIRLEQIKTERIAEEEAAQAILDNRLAKLKQDEQETLDYYARQLEATVDHVAAINDATAQLKNRKVTITTVHKEVHSGSNDDVEEYAGGGPIPEPTLLYGLNSQKVYAIAGERGPERVTSGAGGNVYNLSFNIGRLSANDNREVDQFMEAVLNKIRLATGIRV